MSKNVLLYGSIILIISAIALVALLDRTGSTSQSSDVRARAAQTKTLQLNGTVTSVDETAGTMVLENVFLADESRKGEAKGLGKWTVTAPVNFNFATVFPGQSVVMGIDPKSFMAQTHTVTALTVTAKAVQK